MTFPIEIGIGQFTLKAHLVFETLAFFIGYQYYVMLRKANYDPISSSNRLWVIIGATFGAFFLSRLIGALENPLAWQESTNPFLYFFANKTIVGGLFGGLLGVELIKLLIGEKKSSGDLFTLPIILAMMVGRIGCFSSGVYEDTYGIETTMPWGMNLGDGSLRHPVVLYEMVYLGLLWVLLFQLKTRLNLQEGVLFKIFMLAYFSFRFLIEYIKPTYTFNFDLSTIQISCLILFMYYGKTIFMIIFHPKVLLKDE